MGTRTTRMILKRHMSKLSSLPPAITPRADVTEICRVLASNPKDHERAASLLNSLAVSPSEPVVAIVLRRLSNSGHLALSFFDWAQTQIGFTHTAETFHAVIDSAGKSRNFKKVWDLVDDMRSHDLLSRGTFYNVSRRYARAKMAAEAIKTFEKMEYKYGYKLGVLDFNKLLEVLSKGKMVGKADDVFKKMRKRRIEPDIKSYTVLLEGWRNHPNGLKKIDRVMIAIKESGLKMDAIAFGVAINAYCGQGLHMEAVKIFRQMEAQGVEPSPHILCTMINGMGSAGQLKEAIKFFQRATDMYPPETPTHNALVGAYSQAGKTEEALCVADQMRALGIGPDPRTYDIIIHGLVKADKKEEALAFFKRIRDDESEPVGPNAYGAIGRMLCEEGRTREAEEIVWGPMRTRGVVPAMHLFNTMINTLCQDNDIDGVCRFYEEMISMGFRPTPRLVRDLKSFLLRLEKEDIVNASKEKLQRLITTPRERQYSYFLEREASEAHNYSTEKTIQLFPRKRSLRA